MKRMLLYLLVSSMTMSVFGQKVSVDDESLKMSYRNMPSHPMPENERTFTIIPHFQKATDAMYQVADVRIDGLTYVNTEDADLVVDFMYSGIIEKKVEIATITNKEKKKDGQEITKTSYCVRMEYGYNMSYKVRDKNGNIVTEGIMQSDELARPRGKIEVYKSKEYAKQKEASDYLKANQVLIKKNLDTEIVTDKVKELVRILRYNFGYYKVEKKIDIQYLDSKKHPDFEAHKRLRADLKTGLSMVNENDGVEEAKQTLASSVEFLKGILGNYTDTKDANHKKMRFIAYYDLAQIYLWTDRIGEAKEMLKAGIDNDYEVRDCKRLLEWVEEIEGKMLAAKTSTLHFTLPPIEMLSDTPAPWLRAEEVVEVAVAPAVKKEDNMRKGPIMPDEIGGKITIDSISALRVVVSCEFVDSVYNENRFPDLYFSKKRPSAENMRGQDGYDVAKAHLTLEKVNGKYVASYKMEKLQPNTRYYVYADVNANYVYFSFTDVVEFVTTDITQEQWVDMGLSVKWASCNVGTLSPEAPGKYYAWGELQPKSNYSASTRTIDISQVPMNIAGDAKYDVAAAVIGEGACMPTEDQCSELRVNSIMLHTVYKGVSGYVIESKITHNSIFLPVTGIYDDGKRDLETHSLYWLSERSTSGSDAASAMGYGGMLWGDRTMFQGYMGLPIRPVKK